MRDPLCQTDDRAGDTDRQQESRDHRHPIGSAEQYKAKPHAREQKQRNPKPHALESRTMHRHCHCALSSVSTVRTGHGLITDLGTTSGAGD
jgi:hypothetical protein